MFLILSGLFRERGVLRKDHLELEKKTQAGQFVVRCEGLIMLCISPWSRRLGWDISQLRLQGGLIVWRLGSGCDTSD